MVFSTLCLSSLSMCYGIDSRNVTTVCRHSAKCIVYISVSPFSLLCSILSKKKTKQRITFNLYSIVFYLFKKYMWNLEAHFKNYIYVLHFFWYWLIFRNIDLIFLKQWFSTSGSQSLCPTSISKKVSTLWFIKVRKL